MTAIAIATLYAGKFVLVPQNLHSPYLKVNVSLMYSCGTIVCDPDFVVDVVVVFTSSAAAQIACLFLTTTATTFLLSRWFGFHAYASFQSLKQVCSILRLFLLFLNSNF